MQRCAEYLRLAKRDASTLRVSNCRARSFKRLHTSKGEVELSWSSRMLGVTWQGLASGKVNIYSGDVTYVRHRNTRSANTTCQHYPPTLPKMTVVLPAILPAL